MRNEPLVRKSLTIRWLLPLFCNVWDSKSQHSNVNLMLHHYPHCTHIYYLSPLHCIFMNWCFMSWWDIIHPIKRVHEFNYMTYKGNAFHYLLTLWLTFVSSLYIVLQSKRTCDNMTMIASYVNHQSLYFGIHLQWEPTCS